MARGYSAIGSSASASTNHTVVNVIAATTVRPCVFDIVPGNHATPADQSALFFLGRFTAVGTAGTNPTPQALDPAAVAATATAGQGHSAEPTYTAGATLLQLPLNQRATFRHVASPGYEFIAPATASNGLGWYLSTSTAALIADATIFWYE